MVLNGQRWSVLESIVSRAMRSATALAMLGLQALLSLWVVLAPPTAQAATYAYTSTTFSYVTPSGTANSAVWHNNGNNPGCTGSVAATAMLSPCGSNSTGAPSASASSASTTAASGS